MLSSSHPWTQGCPPSLFPVFPEALLECQLFFPPGLGWVWDSITCSEHQDPGALSEQEATTSSGLMTTYPSEGKLGEPCYHRHPLNGFCWQHLVSPKDNFSHRSSFYAAKNYLQRYDIVFPSLYSEIELSEKARVTPCPAVMFKPHIMHRSGEKKRTLHPEISKRHPLSHEPQNFKNKKQKKALSPFHISCQVPSGNNFTFDFCNTDACRYVTTYGDAISMGETADFPPAKAVMKPTVNLWDFFFF